MCGIFGGTGLSAAELDRALKALAWRGADDAGSVQLGEMHLACARLAISGQDCPQPIVLGDSGQSLGISFNGNLAGAQALRERLRFAGEEVATRNDAELPLRLWRVEGLAGLQRLEGQFAFALYDEAQRLLVLGRDAHGEKPLYLKRDEVGRLRFASSFAALCSGRRPQLSLAAMESFLLRGWLAPEHVPAEVELLPPGLLHCEQLSGESSRVPSRPDPVEASFEDLLLRAVERRLESDREVALFLSGGLDSAAIGLALRLLGLRVRCFSADFVQGREEGERGARIAHALGFEHERIELGPELLDELPRLLAQHGLPFGDASLLALFGLSRAVREQGVGVALLGDGGDELFGGYRRQRAWSWASRYGGWPLRLFANHGHGELGRLARAAARRDYAAFWEQARPRDVQRLLGRSASVPGPVYVAEEDPRLCDLRHYLPEDLCVKADLATLAAGVEGRAPLLDASLIRHAMGGAAPGFDGSSKLPLRRFLARHLPAALREGPKYGFGLPLQVWLRQSSFLDRCWERLPEHGAIDRGLLQRWTNELRAGDGRRAFLLWHAAALACSGALSSPAS
ncbi:MAG: hypothetical protein CSA62_13065 [Planctomycetota bacterium]|nr:MAG: hypothetical protein CSA62_13065 [Planctomycetota bacterium]